MLSTVGLFESEPIREVDATEGEVTIQPVDEVDTLMVGGKPARYLDAGIQGRPVNVAANDSLSLVGVFELSLSIIMTVDDHKKRFASASTTAGAASGRSAHHNANRHLIAPARPDLWQVDAQSWSLCGVRFQAFGNEVSQVICEIAHHLTAQLDVPWSLAGDAPTLQCPLGDTKQVGYR